jgi:type I restriction enzyme S subunit
MFDKAIQKTNEIVAKTEQLKKGLMEELLTKGIGHKEFKDTEIGRIPKEWEVVSLEDVSLKIRTGPFGSQLKKSELSESGLKVYTQENILKSDFSLGNLYIRYEKFERLKTMEVKPGDVLLTIRGSTGYSAVFPEGAERGIIHTNLAYVRVKRSLLLPKYLSLLINDYPLVKSQVTTFSSATTLGALYAKSIKKIIIPLPPLQEQLKITEIFSAINKKLEIEKNEKAKLERIKQGMMDLLLTGKIRVKVA